MDINSIIAIGAIVMANIGTTIGLFTWATSRADATAQNIRNDQQQMSKETQAILKAISDEMKDFHGRLCAIEERAKIRIHAEK